MIAITPKGERTYVCRDELLLPDAKQTRFVIRDLTERERVKVNDAVRWSVDQETGGVSAGTGSKVYMTLRYGLLGSTDENPLVDESGKKVPDPKPDTIDAYLSMLRWDVKEELCLAIQEGLAMTRDEVEKSEPPQSV
jgi:hypothetical protein